MYLNILYYIGLISFYINYMYSIKNIKTIFYLKSNFIIDVSEMKNIN